LLGVVEIAVGVGIVDRGADPAAGTASWPSVAPRLCTFPEGCFRLHGTTYRDRAHRSLTETAIGTREVVKHAVEAGAKILVPVFAIGRTQLLLYLLAGAFVRPPKKMAESNKGVRGLGSASRRSCIYSDRWQNEAVGVDRLSR
jgi:hypothetical protein